MEVSEAEEVEEATWIKKTSKTFCQIFLEEEGSGEEAKEGKKEEASIKIKITPKT